MERRPLSYPTLKTVATVVVVVAVTTGAAVAVIAASITSAGATAACPTACHPHCAGWMDPGQQRDDGPAQKDRAPCPCRFDGTSCAVAGHLSSTPRHRPGRWTESTWYWLLISNAENLSITFVLITLNMYTWVLKQRGTSNYVKHYLAFFAVLLSIRRFKQGYCTTHHFCDGYTSKILGCSEVFALACTNYWQVVMCVEYLYFLRYIDKLNSFTANISARNKIYHVCCCIFSTLWTYSACWLNSHQIVVPKTNSADLIIENNWLFTVQFNYKYLFFFYIPGLTNIITNVLILLFSVMMYNSKTNKNSNKSKGFEKLSIRKQLFVVLTFVWVVDVIAFVDRNNDHRQWLQAMDDVNKALNGTVTCCILVFKRHILAEVTSKLQVYWHHAPYLSRRRISNAICVNPVMDADSNDDRCIL